MTVCTYHVGKTRCDRCVTAVEAELNALPAVQNVGLEVGGDGLQYDRGQRYRPRPDQVRAAIDEAGYALPDPHALG